MVPYSFRNVLTAATSKSLKETSGGADGHIDYSLPQVARRSSCAKKSYVHAYKAEQIHALRTHVENEACLLGIDAACREGSDLNS